MRTDEANPPLTYSVADNVYQIKPRSNQYMSNPNTSTSPYGQNQTNGQENQGSDAEACRGDGQRPSAGQSKARKNGRGTDRELRAAKKQIRSERG